MTGIYSLVVTRHLGYNISFAQVTPGYMSSFYFSARYVLLTYAQSGELSEWAILDHISSLGAECIIGREDHAVEGTHLHVFIDFGRKKQSRRADYFDVGGHHPNIVPSRGRPEGGWDYATKDGNIVAGGLGRPGTSGPSQTKNPWGQIVRAEGREEFLDLVRELDPKSFVLKHQEIVRYADIFFAEDREQYVGPDGIEFELGMVPDLGTWRGESLGDDPIEGMLFDCVGPNMFLTWGGVSVFLRTGRCRGTLRVPTTPNISPVRAVTVY